MYMHASSFYLGTMEYTLNIPSYHGIWRNHLLTTLDFLGREYSVAFSVMPFKFIARWASVIHFTTGDNRRVLGSRIPAVWFSKWILNLHICSSVNRQHNYCNDFLPIQLEKWINVNITQRRTKSAYKYEIFINNNLIHDKINYYAHNYTNVKVYVGDPWHTSQPGFIRNITIKGRVIYYINLIYTLNFVIHTFFSQNFLIFAKCYYQKFLI